PHGKSRRLPTATSLATDSLWDPPLDDFEDEAVVVRVLLEEPHRVPIHHLQAHADHLRTPPFINLPHIGVEEGVWVGDLILGVPATAGDLTEGLGDGT